MAKGPTRQAENYSKAAHNYSIVDDLAQSPTAMYYNHAQSNENPIFLH